MNMYGGLHNIGLWNVDCKKSLENNAAPFLQPGAGTAFREDVDGVSKLEFKLFAKKIFFPGSIKIPENTNYNDYITIVWGIKF